MHKLQNITQRSNYSKLSSSCYKLELTSNTDPYEPVPSVFPVGTTWSNKYCCNLESLLKALDQPCLLAMVSSSLKPCYRVTPERSHRIRRYPRLKWETRRTIRCVCTTLAYSLYLYTTKNIAWFYTFNSHGTLWYWYNPWQRISIQYVWAMPCTRFWRSTSNKRKFQLRYKVCQYWTSPKLFNIASINTVIIFSTVSMFVWIAVFRLKKLI